MTKRSALMLVPLAAFLLGACNQLPEGVNNLGQSREIHLAGSIGSYTKVSGSAFDAGDETGLFIGSPVNVSNVKITSNGEGGFTPSEKLYWAAGQQDDEASEFIAYYPYIAEASVESDLTFELQTDQTSAEALAASDFLYAHAEATPADAGVNLPFNHLMSSFAISVDCMVEGHYITDVTVDGVQVAASVTLADGSVVAAGDPAAVQGAVTNEGFFLVVVPQTASPEIILGVSNGEKVSFTPLKPVEFPAGKTVRAHLVLEMDTISSFTAEVEDWIEDELVIQGEVAGDSGLDHSWYVYLPERNEMIELVPDEGGLLTRRIFGYAYEEFFISKDGEPAQLLGQVYQNYYYAPDAADIKLIYTKDLRYSILVDTDLDIIVNFDPKQMSLSIEEVPYAWDSLGDGKFIDGFIAGLFGFPDQEVDVKVFMSLNYDGVYSLKDPFKDFRWVSEYNFEVEPAELIFVIKEDNKAYFKESYTGLKYRSYGQFWVESLVPETGEEMENYGIFDPENLYISFKERTGTMTDVGGWYSNRYGKMAVTLPGGTRTDRYETVSVDYVNTPSVTDEQKIVNFGGTVGLDVPRVVYAVLPGYLTTDEITAASPAEALEVDESVPGDHYTANWECPESGDYTIIVWGLSEEGEVLTHTSTIFSAKLEMDKRYLAWLGTWSIAAYGGSVYEYTLSINEPEQSYTMSGFSFDCPVYFDQSTGDILFYGGYQVYKDEDNYIMTIGYGDERYAYLSPMARFVMGDDLDTAEIQPVLDDVFLFGQWIYYADGSSYGYYHKYDLLYASQTISRVLEEEGADGGRGVHSQTLEVPSDATPFTRSNK